MDQHEIIDHICAEVPTDTFSRDDIGNLRVGVRISVDFANFVGSLSHEEFVETDWNVVRLRIAEGFQRLYGIRQIAGDYQSARELSSHEQVDYANESTAAGIEFFEHIRTVAIQIAAANRPTALRWKVYPSIVELRNEYLAHIEKLRSEESSAIERIEALMNAIQLQLLFFANTFW